MADSLYKLTYFDLRGSGECVRYIFAYADVQFDDNRVAGEDWPLLKEQQPFGKLPVLDVDGVSITQSTAICRFLGKRFGLTTDDPFKEALLESVIDNIKDVQNKYSKDSPESIAETAAVFADVYSKIEPLAAEGYFYGSEPTWVDVYFAGNWDNILWYKPDDLEPYPNLVALVENIKSKESLQKYLDSRPDN